MLTNQLICGGIVSAEHGVSVVILFLFISLTYSFSDGNLCQSKFTQYFRRAARLMPFQAYLCIYFVEFLFSLILLSFQANSLKFNLLHVVEQTFIFSSPITGRYLRIYSLYQTEAENEDYIRCHMFELIGCVKYGKSFGLPPDKKVLRTYTNDEVPDQFAQLCVGSKCSLLDL